MDKTASLFIILVLTIAVIGRIECKSTGIGPHHLILGERVPGDRLLMSKPVYKKYKFLDIITERMSYTSLNSTINYIEALDRHGNNKGAIPDLIDGGIDTSHVTIAFTSQRGHSIKFHVEIYGH